MINPYLPDLNKIRANYELLKKEREAEEKRRTSLTHPYKTEDDVMQKMRQDRDNTNDVLSKMSPDLRKNSEAMLRLIGENEIAYLYVHPSINTSDFKQQALVQNPYIYNMLSDKDRQDPEISKSYLNGMVNRMQRRQVDATEHSYQFEHQFSSKTNIEQVFSADMYKKAFEAMVQDGPFEDRSLSKNFMLISTARMMRPAMAKEFDEIEKDIWRSQPDMVADLAYGDRRYLDTNYALEAIETRCPEYNPLIERRQKEFWQDRETELREMMDRQDSGEILRSEEIRMLREAEKHIELTKEHKKSEQRVQKEREEELAYLKQDSIDRAYSAAADGDISFSEAANIAAYVGNAPSSAKHGRATEHLANCEARENDMDNVDQELDEELREYDENAKEIVEEERDEMCEEEPEYLPWNYSPPDAERHPVFQTK